MLELPSPLNPRNLQQSDPLVQDPEKNLRISWLERSQLTVFGVRWDSVPWTNFGWIFFNDALEEISSLSSFILGTSFVEKGAVSESSATISYPHLPKFFFFRNKQIAHLEGTEHPSILASVCWRILFLKFGFTEQSRWNRSILWFFLSKTYGIHKTFDLANTKKL